MSIFLAVIINIFVSVGHFMSSLRKYLLISCPFYPFFPPLPFFFLMGLYFAEFQDWFVYLVYDISICSVYLRSDFFLSAVALQFDVVRFFCFCFYLLCQWGWICEDSIGFKRLEIPACFPNSPYGTGLTSII